MKLYIASSWENKDRAANVMRDLESLGHEITLDWTTHETFNWRGEESTRRIAGGWARDDIEAVKRSDAVIILLEGIDKLRTGAACEMGAALALEKHVILYGMQSHPESPFMCHPDVRRSEYGIEHLVSTLKELPNGSQA